jgi:hypothetical protein
LSTSFIHFDDVTALPTSSFLGATIRNRLRFSKGHEEYLSVSAFINSHAGGKRRNRSQF